MLEFKIPEVGENITKGTVVGILVSVGDAVKKDQDLVELETDKASIPIPSPTDGTIKEILIKQGQDVKIGQVVMKIEEKSASGKTPHKETSATSAKESVKTFMSPSAVPKGTSVPTSTPQVIAPQTDVAAAPSVRRLAREIGINVAEVPGTGPRGRISIEDVKAYAKQLNLSRVSGGSGSVMSRALPDFSKWGQVERQPMNNVRKKTSEHLSYCWTTIPHVTQFDKADITALEKLRKRYSTNERKLTVTPFLLKVMAAAMKVFPQFNASVDPAKNEIIYKKYCHIGVAVDTDRGLLVPVVRDIDKKNIFQLADELNEMAERARTKKTSLEELQGGSMTITNLGGIGGTSFTPIVNWPEVAILGVSRARWEPVYEHNQFVPRLMLPLSLSYDHRLIDGADGARFIRWVVEAIEQPFLMEMEG